MGNEVNRLIDMIYERIEEAKSPALKPYMSIVDRDELLDLLEDLRAQLPVEMKRAQELLLIKELSKKLAAVVIPTTIIVQVLSTESMILMARKMRLWLHSPNLNLLHVLMVSIPTKTVSSTSRSTRT